jgi:nicotinamide-nucleotide amidase
MSPVRSAAVVLSGNELLDGRTADTNGVFAAADLSDRGVKVTSLLTVADDRARLAAALRFALDAAPDVLVLGGGLGTTHDDLTAQCLADVLDVPLHEHPEALAMVEQRVRELARRRGQDFAPVFALARRQALLPRGAAPLAPAGVAPGIAAQAGATRIYALPGVPFEFRRMWSRVAAELHEAGEFPSVVARLVRIFGVGELQVGPVLDAAPHELLETGINVGGGEVLVKLRYPAAPAAARQADELVAALRAAVPVYSTDGRGADELVADALRSAGATLAVAESCTGGLLGARITARAGSSDYFLGGVISYANEVKAALLGVPDELLQRYGAVSDEVAAAMAEGARRATGADYALSVTGVAGPDGGTAEKPVGLVHVACSGPGGTRSTRNVFPGDRDTIRQFSATRALHLLLEELGA